MERLFAGAETRLPFRGLKIAGKSVFGSSDARGRLKVTIEFDINNFLRKTAAMVLVTAISAVLLFSALRNLIVGVLTDSRVEPRLDLLAAATAYVPNSAGVNARLAAAQLVQADRDLSAVAPLAQRAVDTSPWDYRNRLLMATVKEAQGDRAAAEESLREASSLAPNYTDVHWRLANLLLREGKLAKSVSEFRQAIALDARLLPSTQDLLWRVSGGNSVVIQAVTSNDPAPRLVLAQFLLNQSRIPDAITVFAGIDRASLARLPETPTFIDALTKTGHWDEARGLWVGLVSGIYAQPGRPLPVIWNGGFESEISRTVSQFDWSLVRNEYVSPDVDTTVGHTGDHSLRLNFSGRDTTRLDGQAKQIITVRPGVRYTFECYAKTEHLETPEGPRIVIADLASGVEVASSAPVSSGSSDWRRLNFDFSAPQSARAVVLTIKRVPKFSYDNPTRGTIWFDDFAILELVK